MSKHILDDVITIKIPKGFDKDEVTKRIQCLLENLALERKEHDEKIKLENKIIAINNTTATNDILNILKADKDFTRDIVNYSKIYREDIFIRLVTQFYCKYYDLPIVYDAIFFDTESSVILGMIINIPIGILEKMVGYHTLKEWIKEEMEYYKINNHIRIDNVCKMTHFDHNCHLHEFLTTYLLHNHYDLLKKYDSKLLLLMTLKLDATTQLYAMKDTLKNL